MREIMKSETDSSVGFPTIAVKPSVKAGLYGLCFLLMSFFAWGLITQVRSSNNFAGALAYMLLMLAIGWFFLRIYSLCSIVINETGVTQHLFLQNSQLVIKASASWQAIERVSFSHLSYYFYSTNNFKFELHTASFSNPKKIIQNLRTILPPQLRAQLDGCD
jgi:hypothetical protein